MMRRVQTVYEGESLGQRLGKFAALLISVFAIVAAVVVTQRLSDDALALVVGLLLAGIPLLAIVALLGFFVVKQATREPRQQVQPQPQQMSIPPIILQMPTAPQQAQLPDYGGQRQRGGARSWDMIGDED